MQCFFFPRVCCMYYVVEQQWAKVWGSYRLLLLWRRREPQPRLHVVVLGWSGGLARLAFAGKAG